MSTEKARDKMKVIGVKRRDGGREERASGKDVEKDVRKVVSRPK